MSSIPTFSYDVLDNDFVHESYTIPTHRGFNFDTTLDGMLVPTSSTPNDSYGLFLDGGPAATFETYNLFPQFPFTRTPSFGSSTSLASMSTHSPGFSLGNISQFYPELQGHIAEPFAAPPTNSSEVAVSVRSRCRNKRPRGMGFAELMHNLPPDVQAALQRSYEGCCDLVNQKDNSTWQKHVFSNRHCSRLARHQQELLPSFVCPAFIAFHSKCKNARAGRYDSTERHCKNCPGFMEMHSTANVFPVQITKGEYGAIQIARSTNMYDENTVFQAQSARDKLLRMMFDAMTLEYGSDAMGVTADSEEPFTF